MIFERLKRYSFVGVLNFICHSILFTSMITLFEFSISIANTLAFLTTASLSFFVNARWTFEKQPTVPRLILFLVVMSLIAFATGFLSVILKLPAFFAVLLLALINWIIGFLSSYFIFSFVR